MGNAQQVCLRIAAHIAGPGRASYRSDAAQSSYTGRQNVVNSRNVIYKEILEAPKAVND